MASITENPAKTSSVARVLVDLLSLGLPEPSYASVSDGSYPSVLLLFSYTADPVGSLHAWADRFGVPLVSRPDQVNAAGQHYIGMKFMHSGAEIGAFAYTDPF